MYIFVHLYLQLFLHFYFTIYITLTMWDVKPPDLVVSYSNIYWFYLNYVGCKVAWYLRHKVDGKVLP